MARKHDDTGQTLEEIQHRGDQLAQWASDNRVALLAAGVVVLLAAGGYGFWRSAQEDGRVEASAALSQVVDEYRSAMGTAPDSILVGEPANAEMARETRTAYLARFQEVADAHRGTAAGALAALEVGTLEAELGDGDQAIETWRAAAATLPAAQPVRALLLSRVAAGHETAGRWLEAAQAYEEAASVADYPLRGAALADAARCYAQDGQDEAAIALFERVREESPDLRLPEHVEARLAELQARQHAF